MKRVCLFFVCWLLFSSFFSFSQTIRGRVIDINRSPIMSAQIVLSQHDSIIDSAFTDDEGLFRLNYKQHNNFEILTYYSGYKTNKQTMLNASGDIKIQDIVLAEDTLNLEEVTVISRSSSNYGDRVLLFPNLNDVKTSQNVLDLFQKSNLPGLSVNMVSKTLSINGRTDIIYRINGINASQEEVTALNPNQIDRIEYERIPANIRDINNAGVINVILKRDTGTSLSTEATSAVSTGFMNGNLNLTSGFSNSYFSFNYGANWRNYNEWTSEENESFLHLGNPETFSKTTNPSLFGYLQQNMNLGYTYIKDKNTFNLRFLNNIYTSHEDYNIDIDNLSKDSYFNRNIHSKTKLYIPSLDFYYIRNIDDKQKIEMNLNGALSTSDHNRNTLDCRPKASVDSIKSNINGNSKSIAYEILYTNKGGRFSYNVGVKSSYTILHNESKSSKDRDDINRLDIYPYASIGSKFHFLNFTLGAGLKVLNNKSGDLSRTYYSSMNNLSLFSRFKDISLQYVFRYLPNYPQMNYMTDITQQQDPYMYIAGNPHLETSNLLLNNLELSYQQKYFNALLSFYSSHEYSPIRDIVSYQEGKYISRFENIDKEELYGTRFYVFFPSILNMFKIRLESGVNYYKTSFNEQRKKKLTNFYYSAYLEYFKNNFSLYAGWRKPSKSLSGEFVTQGENNSYVTAAYRIKNLLFGLSLYYPFCSGAESKVNRESEIYRNNRTVTIKDNAYMLVLGFVYNINWGKSPLGVQKNLNNLNQSSPIKY